MHDTPPRTVLSLKKATAIPATEPATQSPVTPVPKAAKKKKRRKQPFAYQCLQTYWPELFKVKPFVPLQVGITASVIERLKQAGEPLTEKQIGAAIGWHCLRNEYLKAVANSSFRVGLDGEQTPLSEAHSKGALSMLKTRIKSAKARAIAQSQTEQSDPPSA